MFDLSNRARIIVTFHFQREFSALERIAPTWISIRDNAFYISE